MEEKIQQMVKKENRIKGIDKKRQIRFLFLLSPSRMDHISYVC